MTCYPQQTGERELINCERMDQIITACRPQGHKSPIIQPTLTSYSQTVIPRINHRQNSSSRYQRFVKQPTTGSTLTQIVSPTALENRQKGRRGNSLTGRETGENASSLIIHAP